MPSDGLVMTRRSESDLVEKPQLSTDSEVSGGKTRGMWWITIVIGKFFESPAPLDREGIVRGPDHRNDPGILGGGCVPGSLNLCLKPELYSAR